MKLIQLLLNNWFVIVVLFIILSNIGKMVKSKPSKEPGKQSVPKQGMPPFAGGGGGTGWGRTVKQTVTQAKDVISRSEQSKKPSNPRVQEPSQPAYKVIPEAQEADVWKDSPLENNRQPAASRASRKPLQPANAEKSRTQPSANQLAQGVVWAEILGPPRAKKPYGKK